MQFIPQVPTQQLEVIDTFESGTPMDTEATQDNVAARIRHIQQIPLMVQILVSNEADFANGTTISSADLEQESHDLFNFIKKRK